MQNKTIKIAAIGLGWVSCNRHIPAIQNNPDFQLVGVIDPKENHAKNIAQKLNLPHYAKGNSLNDIAWLYDVDAVVIGSPPMNHKELAINALQKGKHVLIEKPFAMTIDEANEIINEATTANKTLSIVHNFQFSTAFNKLKSDINKNKLGEIQNISATQHGNPKRRLPSWYEKLPMGLFYDESPHFYYLLNELTNNSLTFNNGYYIKSRNNKNTPDIIHLVYKNNKNIPVTINCNFNSSISEWHIIVSGNKGIGIIDIFRDIYIYLPNDKSHNAFNIIRTSTMAFFQHFMQHIPNGFKLITGKLDYGNDEIIKRFASSIKTGKEDDKIGFTKAMSILKLQHEAISKIQDI